MVTPNTDTAIFINWLLTSGFHRPTPPRIQLYNLVYAAAINQTPITDLNYNTFVRVSSWLYPVFLQWIALTNQPQYDIIMSRNIFAFQNTPQSITGDTANHILASILIPANSMNINSRLIIEGVAISTIDSDQKIFWLRSNTIPNSFVGSTEVSKFLIDYGYKSVKFSRTISNDGAINSNFIFPKYDTQANDNNYSALDLTSLNLDFSIDQYILLTCQLANNASNFTLNEIYLYIDKSF